MNKIKKLSIPLCLYFLTSCGGSNTINDIQTLEQKALEIPPNFELKPPSDNENVLSQEIIINDSDSNDVEDILNSDSSSASGIAAQLTATKGAFERLLFLCIKWAINSLPVPDSPITKILATLLATFSANFRIFDIFGSAWII